MNQWGRFTVATRAAGRAAWNVFRRVYADPSGMARRETEDARLADYATLWAYHENSVFDDVARWQTYRTAHRLYRATRPIYNPARRLARFYTGVVYQGEWATDPAQMTAKTSAIPWSERTPAPLLGAIAQIYQWSNWQSRKNIALRYAAAVGDVLVTVVDDLSRGKVYPDVVWPGHVVEIDLDPTGNVTYYAIDYDADELDERGQPTGQSYVFRREVSKTRIAEFHDTTPTLRAANPYGFVPAVWMQHTATGGTHGQSALGNPSKIDELNSLAAHALDQAHRILEAPILIAGQSVGGNLSDQAKAAAYGRVQPQAAAQEELKIITAAQGSEIQSLRLESGETLAHIDHLLVEIERDYPELGMFAKLREMSNVTGPGADRMFGDVASLVNEARAQYDQQTVKLFQMCTAVAGWRANDGAWGLPSQLSQQQRAFLPFNLDSYARGDLDTSIQSRGLIMPSPEEELRLEQMRVSLEADRAFAQPQTRPQAVADRLRAGMAGQTQPVQAGQGAA